MDGAVHVRPAGADDLAACGRLASRYSGGAAAAWAERFGALLLPGPHTLFVAAEPGYPGEIVGYARNVASLRLHAKLSFVEVTRDFSYPGVEFSGGVGVLCRADVTGSAAPSVS